MNRTMKMWLAAACAALIGIAAVTIAPPLADAQAAASDSQVVAWNCTSSPCPWGSSASGHAAVWDQPAFSQRLGYTTTQPVYLPASRANGLTVSIASGSAAIYVGAPQAGSHSKLVALWAGQTYTISGVAADAVISLQSGNAFNVTTSTTGPTTTTTTGPATTTTLPATTTTLPATTTTLPATTTTLPATTTTTTAAPTTTTTTATTTTLPATTTTTTAAPTTTTTTAAPTTTTTTVPVGSNNVALVTWNCTSNPCPWGNSTSGHAATWTQPAGSERFGYTTSQAVYLPAHRANGMIITIQSGSAGVYAGTPQASSHAQLAFLYSGQSYTINGLAADTVISVQSGASFTYGTGTGTGTTTTTTTTVPGPTTTVAPGSSCTDPTTCEVVDAITARWECNTAGCTSVDWNAAVINWPSWSAYSTNARQGAASRTVYATAGNTLLTPYMGAWANGCEVTAVSGSVIIIEWERGTNEWREVSLLPGDTHTISITSPENGAMIETYEGYTNFKVSLANCTPAPVPNAG